MKIIKESVSVTVAVSTSGATAYTARPMNGLIHAVEYVRGSASQLSSTATLTIKGSVTGNIILDSLAVGGASFFKYVRENTVVDTTNGAVTTVACMVPVVDERVSVAVGDTTGNNLSGTFNIFLEGASG